MDNKTYGDIKLESAKLDMNLRERIKLAWSIFKNKPFTINLKYDCNKGTRIMSMVKRKTSKKVRVYVKEDINGTYFVSGMYFVDVPATKPYTKEEKNIRKIENIFPHLTLIKMRAKINKVARKNNHKAILVIERFRQIYREDMTDTPSQALLIADPPVDIVKHLEKPIKVNGLKKKYKCKFKRTEEEKKEHREYMKKWRDERRKQ